MGVAASNINIIIYYCYYITKYYYVLFSEQRILGVHVTIVQRKISGELTRTCF